MSTFDIGKSVNDAADWLTSSTLIYTLTSNTMYMAILLTIALLFIISYINESKSKYKYTKLAIYLFFANCILLFVHHIALSKRIEKSFKGEHSEEIIKDIDINKFDDSTITPKIIKGGEVEEPEIPEIQPVEMPKDLSPESINQFLQSTGENNEIINKYSGNLPKIVDIKN